MKHLIQSVLPACAGLLLTVVSAADDVAAAARQVLNDHQAAVVVLDLAIALTVSAEGYGSETGEDTMVSTGIVISPDGVVAASLTESDPALLYGDYAEVGTRFEATIKGVSVTFGDGQELDAEVVLRDREQDLIFYRLLEAPEDPLPFLKVDGEGPTAEVFDEVVGLYRYGKALKQACGGFIDRINLVIERPRRRYVTGWGTLGAPIFTKDGRFLGIVVMKNLGEPQGDPADSDSNDVVVPASDIAEAAAQIPSR